MRVCCIALFAFDIDNTIEDLFKGALEGNGVVLDITVFCVSTHLILRPVETMRRTRWSSD
jgi:hypothetical protein